MRLFSSFVEFEDFLKSAYKENTEYTDMFLKKKTLNERQCVYISKKAHGIISEIVRVIADKDISVGGYIDNVLMQHLEAHRDEINELYRQDRKDLIP